MNNLKAVTAKANGQIVYDKHGELYLKSEVVRYIENLKNNIISMFRERRYCIGLDLHSIKGQIANAAYKHWHTVELIRIENATLKKQKTDLINIAESLRFELKETKLIKNHYIAHHKRKRLLSLANHYDYKFNKYGLFKYERIRNRLIAIANKIEE